MAKTVTPTATPRRPRHRPKGAITQSSREPVKNEVALLRAEGMTYEQVGKTLGMGKMTAHRIGNLPEVQERIASLRTQWKEVVNEKLQGMAENTMAMLENTVTQRDTQAFMRTSIGLANLERVSTSASGEKQKVEVSGVPGDSNPRIEIKNLLVALFGEAKPQT